MPDAVCAYISAGANLDPEQNILRALELLADSEEITGVSTFYVTPALGRPEQPEYRNGVVRLRTALPARQLKFDVLRKIESALGRVRNAEKYAPREIDLDILLYGNEIIADKDLRIPDPDLRSRIFLALPLFELTPALRLPDTGEALADLDVLREAPRLSPAPAFTAVLKERLLK